MKRRITALVIIAALLAAWETLVRTKVWSPLLVPTPLGAANYLWTGLISGELLTACWVTLKRLLLGYAVGLALGLPLGFLTALFKPCRDTIGVIALGLQTLPSVCWAPLAIIWFGQTEAAMIFIVIMGSLWSITLATENGVRNAPEIYARAARTMGSRGLHTWVHVIFPASLPFIVSGMKQGWAFAWRSLMAAEIYIVVLTGSGLGLLLNYARELQNDDAVLGIMLVIIAIGLAADKILFTPLERFMHRRWGTGR